jgi:hypothetical protein
MESESIKKKHFYKKTDFLLIFFFKSYFGYSIFFEKLNYAFSGYVSFLRADR